MGELKQPETKQAEPLQPSLKVCTSVKGRRNVTHFTLQLGKWITYVSHNKASLLTEPLLSWKHENEMAFTDMLHSDGFAWQCWWSCDGLFPVSFEQCLL